MRSLVIVVWLAGGFPTSPAHADCNLSAAPEAIKQKARDFYYAQPKRDSAPPGALVPPPSAELGLSEPTQPTAPQQTVSSASGDAAAEKKTPTPATAGPLGWQPGLN